MKRKSLEFGPVVFAQGRYKGRIGFYDDDAMTDAGNPCAIVYLGEPFKSKFYRVHHREIRNITPKMEMPAIAGALA